MEEIRYDLVADIREDGANYIAIKVPQDGIGIRNIYATVVDDGVPWDIPTGNQVSYTVKGHNAAGGAVEEYCRYENNKIVIPVIESMASFHGVGKYRVEIYDSSTEVPTLSTFSFCIAVEKDPLSATEVIASDDYRTLKALIERVEGATSNWLIGNGSPSNAIGIDLDLYLDIDSGKVYKKVSGAWVYQGTLGTQIYFAYATSSAGANFSITYDGTQTYLGICASQSESQPLTPASYTWVMIAGGDNMRVTDYGGSDSHTVAQADSIKGEVLINNIIIPANTSTSTTTVTVTDQRIQSTSYIKGVYTNVFGLNLLSMTVGTGTATLVFPASASSAMAVIELYNN